LIIVLGSSLFVGLVVNPMLTSVYMKLKEKEVNPKKIIIYSSIFIVIGLLLISVGMSAGMKALNAIGLLSVTMGVLRLVNTFLFTPGTAWFQNKLIPVLEHYYEKTLRFALRGKNRILVFGGTILMLFVSFILMGIFPPKVLFFPETPPKQVYVFIEYPEGTDIEKTNELTVHLEKDIMEHLDKYQDNGNNFLVNSVIGQVGEGTADPNQDMGSGVTPNKARITIDFVDYEFRRGIDSKDVMDEIREVVKKYPGVKISVDKPQDGPPTGAPINIEISGDDYDKVMVWATQIKDHIEKSGIQGYEALKLDVERDKPELLIHVDREKARSLNVSTGQIGDAIRTSIYGK
jgi:multidrug efflux pump subunit AcrB